jgi:hypothetical protein
LWLLFQLSWLVALHLFSDCTFIVLVQLALWHPCQLPCSIIAYFHAALLPTSLTYLYSARKCSLTFLVVLIATSLASLLS